MNKIYRSIMILLLINIMSLSSAFAEDYTRWELPEGAKLRLGKGKLANFEGHLTTIGKGSSYHFTPDSTKLVVFTSIGIWVYDVQTGKEVRLSTADRFWSHDDVALSPNSKMYAKIRNHRIELREINTNELITTFEGSDERNISVAFSADGKTIASTDFSGIIRLWDVDGKNHSIIVTPHRIVSRVMFSPDNKTIVSSRKQEVMIWEIETGKFKTNLEETDGVDNIIFNFDGSSLFGLTKDEARFWDIETGKVKMRIGHKRTYRHLYALSPNGKTLATARGNDNTVQLWDTETGQLKNTLTGDSKTVKMLAINNGIPMILKNMKKPVRNFAYSPDGRTLAVSSRGEIILWDPDTGKPKAILTGKESYYYLVFSPDGRTLATRSNISNDGTRISLWNIDTTDIQNSGLRHIIKDHTDEISSITFHPDGNMLASGYRLGKIRLWNSENGQLKTTCNGYPFQLFVQSLTFTPNGKTLTCLNISSQSSAGKAEVLFWDAMTGEYQRKLKGHGKAIGNTRRMSHGGGIEFNPNGEMFVTGSLDGPVRLWNANAIDVNSPLQWFVPGLFSPQTAKLKGHTDQILCIALNPNGSIIASGSSDQTIRLWDVNKREHIATLEGHTEEVLTVTFSPDGKTLASGCRHGSIHLWDAHTGKHKISLIGNRLFSTPPSLPPKKDDPPNITARGRSDVSSLIFSPDGNILVNGNRDGTIHFWDIKTRQIKSSFSGQGGLNSLAFSPDGRTLASGSSDGTVLIWDIPIQ